ncbi:MAG: arsenate reductase-like glutaredoxin family protein [Pseudohongiellaceae bacterium]|jgi:arsenate reductase-like glutaredoxin family protein
MGRKIDWYYRRNSCATCAKADAFLEARGLTPREVVDSRKSKLPKRETVPMLRTTQRLVSMKGKTLHDWNLKKNPPMEIDLFEAIMGSTGNLRTPALRIGKTLVVGFNETVWAELLA